VPENLEDVQAFQVSGAQFRAMATDALKTFKAFLVLVDANTPAWHDGPRVPDRQTEPQAWHARNLHDRTVLLREAFTTACFKIGATMANG
jgi:hypothetical protein